MTVEPFRAHAECAKTALTDFQRDVHCVLGLPIDAVTLAGAVERVSSAAACATRCIVSTPNVNILLASHKDPIYRDALVRADLSLADGAPIVWIARLLGTPVTMRVAGASVFQALMERSRSRLRVYFFGGPDGAAAKACALLNEMNGPLSCVGSAYPGFGSVEDLSAPHFIDDINRSNADFLVVGIAAKKAYLWIDRNRELLQTPVMAGLGAVVNFVSRRIGRAPERIQRLGLEWLWRIKEEPVLWKRYVTDGLALLRIAATRVAPLLWLRFLDARRAGSFPPEVTMTTHGNATRIVVRGAWVGEGLEQLRSKLQELTAVATDVEVDLSNARSFDCAFIGLLMLLYGHQQKVGRSFSIIGTNRNAQRLLELNCAGFLLRAG